MASNPGSSAFQAPQQRQQQQKQLSPIDDAKRRAAYRAVADHLSHDARYVGIGSGSTVVFVVEAIARLGPAVTARMVFIPTGFQSRELIVQAGLRLGTIDALVPLDTDDNDNDGDGDDGDDDKATARHVMLDVAFDGADEVDDELNCIKGGGACLFQEKLVATSARKFICVADYRKLQPRLLTKWPTVPIEVVPAAAPSVLRALRRLGSPAPFLRPGGAAKAGPIVTDNGNFIIDAPFPAPLLTRADVRRRSSPSSSTTTSSTAAPTAAADANADSNASTGTSSATGTTAATASGADDNAAASSGTRAGTAQPHEQQQQPSPPPSPRPQQAQPPRQHEWDVDSLAQALKQLVGVVETGLFCGPSGLEAEQYYQEEEQQHHPDHDHHQDDHQQQQQQQQHQQRLASWAGIANIGGGGGQKPVAAYFGQPGGEVIVRRLQPPPASPSPSAPAPPSASAYSPPASSSAAPAATSLLPSRESIQQQQQYL